MRMGLKDPFGLQNGQVVRCAHFHAVVPAQFVGLNPAGGPFRDQLQNLFYRHTERVGFEGAVVFQYRGGGAGERIGNGKAGDKAFESHYNHEVPRNLGAFSGGNLVAKVGHQAEFLRKEL
jgi:hypothetical protein